MKYWVPPFAALVGWAFADIAFPGSAPDCRVIYDIIAAVGMGVITAAVLWLPRVAPEDLPPERWYPAYPPQQIVYPPSAYSASSAYADWAEGQRERARLMWLDGTPTPPTDWFGDRGR